MKKTIRTLYEYYYSLKMVIDETIISGQGATMRVIVTTQLAPSVWGVKDEHGRLDIKTAEEIMFKERERLSSQLFSMTLSILKEEGKFPKIDENDKKNAEAKMKWVTDRLLELDILDPYDKMYLSTLVLKLDRNVLLKKMMKNTQKLLKKQ